MKSKILTYIVATTTIALTAPIRLIAQDNSPRNNHQTRYSVQSLSTLGGTYGTAQQMNGMGVIAGDANLAGDTTEHATLWRDGVIRDLGTLGGLNSAANSINDRGLVLGTSETASVDPLGENWGLLFTCSPSGGSCQGYENLVLAFLWQNGVMTALPTLGGNNATNLNSVNLNDRGEAVGYAENSTQDPNCVPPQVLDYEAVIWGPGRGEIRELSPLPGDSVGAALGINDKGQVVGTTSSTCAFPSFGLPTHAVLWQNGTVTNLGSLGGVMSNAAWAINNQGQIVGFSDLPGDTATHAVLWQNGRIMDLGTLPGDYFSYAYGINDRGQVIVQSCDINFNCRAALWQNGVMTDLNTLTPPGSLYLVFAGHIDNRGEITGQGFDQNTGGTPAFLATPCDGEGAGNEGCRDGAQGTNVSPGETREHPKVVLPDNIREQLRQRLRFGPFGVPPMGSQ